MTPESEIAGNGLKPAGAGCGSSCSTIEPLAVDGRIAGSTARHIAVCVCTYRRSHLLKHLLEKLKTQETDGLFTFSVVVVDNDHAESGKAVVSEFMDGSPIKISYHVEPRQNIALARNKAVQNAAGDFVAFIDDDEVPTDRWLATLFKTCERFQVDGVLGPVKPYFDESAPKWLVEGRFYDRPSYPTGFVIEGRNGRTGNVLLRRAVFSESPQPFRPEFRTGEDQDFFRRMIERKKVFVWCDEAVAYEAVPPTRWKRSFLLRRALLRGQNAVIHPTFGFRDITKSLIAVPAYSIALPLAFLLGQHKFMNLLVRLFDHLGKLMALMGINAIASEYITD
ncbi:MAG TPA: glycosyltransferase [Terriglobia bacterium]|nr:glycosyltransferase [Terriglobia bacterium]